MIKNFTLSAQNRVALNHSFQSFEVEQPRQLSDTYCQDSMVQSLSHIHQIHQHTPYFAQSSIRQKSHSINQIQEIAQDFFQKISPNPFKQTRYPPSKAETVNKLDSTQKVLQNNRISNIERIVSSLSATHKSMKLNLAKIKKQSKCLQANSRKENMAFKCNGKPVLAQLKNSFKCVTPRYRVTGNMTERQSERLAVRCKTEAAKIIEKMEAEMKESKKKSKDILIMKEVENRKTEMFKTNSKANTNNFSRKFEEQTISERSTSPSFNYKHIKNVIKFEINGLKLD